MRQGTWLCRWLGRRWSKGQFRSVGYCRRCGMEKTTHLSRRLRDLP